MSTDIVFSHESIEDRQSVGAYLNAIRDGIGSGRLTLTAADKSFILEPSDVISFGFQVERKEMRTAVTLTLNWREGGEVSVGESKLVIEVG